MPLEQVAECVEFADAPFGSGGQVGLDEREFGEAGEGAPGASGTALLDLHRPDRPLCFVVGEDVQIRVGGEPQDQVLEAEEPAGEAAGVLRGRAPAVEVGGQAGGGEFPVRVTRSSRTAAARADCQAWRAAEAASRASISRAAIREAQSCLPGSKSYRPFTPGPARPTTGTVGRLAT